MASAEKNNTEFPGQAWLATRFDQRDGILNDIKTRLDVLESDAFSAKATCDILDRENSALKQEVKKLKEDVRYLEANTRRDNMRFFNVPDKPTESTEKTLCRFISDKLKLDANEIDFSIVHRLGAYKTGQSRCIMAWFVRRKDINKVKAACVNLRGTKFGVAEDLPSEWAAARRQAYLIHVKPAKADNKKVHWKADKLFIDGKQVDIRSSSPPTPTDSTATLVPAGESNNNNDRIDIDNGESE